MPAIGQCLRYLWASPNSLIGILFAIPAWVGLGGRTRMFDGVLEVHGGLATFFLNRICSQWLSGGAAAMTLGHVVIGVDEIQLHRTRKHERVHVRQYELWGPLFLPAYGMASLLAWLRGKDAYRENRFEREAYRIAP